MKIVMLMSGGVDSSVAAHLLKKEGHEVIGLHYKTVNDNVFTLIPEKTKVCCSPADTYDAQRVAKQLNLDDFRILRIEDEFEDKVLKYFIQEYKEGRTPNPCIICNRYFKFGKAVEYANEIGADFVASGHYVIREFSEKYNTQIIKRGIDNYKDQSYFLSLVRKEYLEKMTFPLGRLMKTEIRKIADELGLVVANKPDSQELCFIPDNDYKRYLAERGINPQEGSVVDLDGNRIGTHSGYTSYTIGQRAGMTFFKGLNQKLHVYKIIPETNTIVVAPTEKVYFKGLIAKNLNYFVDFEKMECVCRVRKKCEESPAIVEKIDNDTVKVRFKEPIFAVAPGQYATFYDNDGIVLGSGVITEYLED